MKKFLFTLSIVLAMVTLFGISSFIIQLYGFQENSYATFTYIAQYSSVGEVLNNPLFWTSSVGLSLKMLIDIVVISVVVWTGFVASRKPLSLHRVIPAIAIAHSVFLLQYLIEAIYLLNFTYKDAVETLSLFSIGFFMYAVEWEYLPQLAYAFQILSIFEILFVVVAAWFLTRSKAVSFKDSLRIVAIFYGGALLIWLLFVTMAVM